MSHQFKPGDPALVIAGNTFLGCQVEVMSWVNPGDEITGPDGGEWRLNPQSPSGGWLVECSGGYCVKYPKSLMPLRGDFSPEQQKAQEAEKC
uniref:ATPase n=4 Tax=unclassified bacterial viruses TaxID=12333 RepID=A0AAU6W455_9VIRU